jgi:DNA (cytosine-5)-methyltransferase 1
VAGDIAVLLTNDQLTPLWSGAAPDLIIGGPPCTAFSHAGFWIDYKREGRDAAADGIDHFATAVEQFRPRAFVLENVPGILFRNHQHRLEQFIKRVKKVDYQTRVVKLDASRFGTAQARKRVFVVGTRGPSPLLSGLEWDVQRTAGWALQGIENNPHEADEVPRGKYLELLRGTPAGANYLVHTKERGCSAPAFKYRGRYWSFLLKLHPDAPSPTLPAQRVTWNGPFHWENRHLRLREMARLQGFPDHMPFNDSLGDSRRQVGNAVPVPLAAAVISAVIRSLGGCGIDPELERVLRHPEATAAEVHEHLAHHCLRQRHLATG